MSEQTPGVTVHRPSGSRPDNVRHPEADAVRVDDGHLLVLKNGIAGETVAIYAPGSWQYATVGTGK